MQNVDEVKELKALTLKNECLKKQSQSFNNNNYN